MNSVSLIGRLTRDPELRHTPSGTTVCQFGLAVDRAGDRDENEKGGYGAGFFDVSLFGKTAEVAAQYLAKGRQVGIQGSLRFHRWQAEDGSNRSKVEISGQSMTFVGGNGDGNGGSQPQSQQPSFVPSGAAADDDIPF